MNEVEAARESHQKDIALIGEALMKEAQERDWCADFDTFVERLNDKLNVKLPTREVAFDVAVIITVTASNAGQARNSVEDVLQGENYYIENVGEVE